MKLRRLNQHGIEQFTSWLNQLRSNGKLEIPTWLLTDPSGSERAGDAWIEQQAFPRRLDAAAYLNDVLRNYPDVDRDAGLWGWLTLYYFDQLCPKRKDGSRKPRELVAYLLAVGDFQKYYRHLLFGPYLIYRAYADAPERALALLLSPPSVIDDIVGQLAARRDLVTNRTVISLATNLYVDAESGKFRSGARGKGAGSPRRFSDFLNQLDLTYDLSDVEEDRLRELLPREFDRFSKNIAVPEPDVAELA